VLNRLLVVSLLIALFSGVWIISCTNEDDNEEIYNEPGQQDMPGVCDAACFLDNQQTIQSCINDAKLCVDQCENFDQPCIEGCMEQGRLCPEQLNQCFIDCEDCTSQRLTCIDEGTTDFQLCIDSFWDCNNWDRACFEQCALDTEDCTAACIPGSPEQSAQCILDCDLTRVLCEAECL